MVDQLEIELFKVLTLPGRGAERRKERNKNRRGGVLPSPKYV
jgi:hypothetical protein